MRSLASKHFRKKACLLAGICFNLIFTQSAKAETTYSFTATLPTYTNLSQLEVSSSALKLTQTSGAYNSEGYIDIPVTSSTLSGKLIKLDATRVNSLVDGDFESSQTVYTKTPSTCNSCNLQTKSVGYWFQNGLWTSSMPLITTDSTGTNYVGKMDRVRSTLLQYFRTTAGASYTLSFDMDTSHLAERATTTEDDEDGVAVTEVSSTYEQQSLNIYTGFLNDDFNRVNFYDPYHNSNYHDLTDTVIASGLEVMSYDIDDGSQSESFRVKVIDCDEHTQYSAASGGLYPTDISFNFCKDASGANQQVLDDDDISLGTTYTASDLEYGSIVFQAGWFATSAETEYNDNYATIDNIVLDREDQIEVQLLDASGAVVQSSALDKGFYVESATNIATLRLYLRSDRTDVSPEVRSLSISDGLDISVSMGDEIAEFTEARIGGTYSLPPRSEYLDTDLTTQISQCIDILNENAQEDCYDYFANNDMKNMRGYLSQGEVEASWSDTLNDYEFRSLSPTAELTDVIRQAQRDDAGMILKYLILTDAGDRMGMSEELYDDYCATITGSTSTTWEDKARNNCCYRDDSTSTTSGTVATPVAGREFRPWYDGLTCSLGHFVDRTGTRTSITDQSLHMVALYADFLARLYNGTTRYNTTSGVLAEGDATPTTGTTLTMPRVDIFEIFGETNRTPYRGDTVDMDWDTTLTASPDFEDPDPIEITQAQFVEMLNSEARAIRARNSNAKVALPSVLATDESGIDNEYLEDKIGQWDADSFTEFTIHPYMNGNNLPPESLWDTWSETSRILSANGWGDYPVHITEWGFTQEIYEPYCYYDDSDDDNDGVSDIYDTDDADYGLAAASATGRYVEDTTYSNQTYWTRGYGEAEKGKLTARQALVNLHLPTTTAYIYGMFTYETEYGGGNISTGSTYPCWQRINDPNFSLHERVVGTGILSGQLTTDSSLNNGYAYAPSVYQANDAGTAYMHIAQNLSLSSPYESTITVTDTASRSDVEPYYSAFYKTGENTYVLALWWYKTYNYGTNADFMNYTYRTKDYGFEEKRIHNVTLSGVSGLSSATVKYLDGTADQTLTYTTNSDGNPVLSNVVFGEMPILISLQVTAASPDGGSGSGSTSGGTTGTTSGTSTGGGTSSGSSSTGGSSTGGSTLPNGSLQNSLSNYFLTLGGGCSLNTQ